MDRTTRGEQWVLFGAFVHITISIVLIVTYIMTKSSNDNSSTFNIELITRVVSLLVAIIGYILIYRGSDLACKVCSIILTVGVIRVIISLAGNFHLMLSISLITSLLNIYILVFSADVKAMIRCKVENIGERV